MKVFSKEKYLKQRHPIFRDAPCPTWADECDGKPVFGGYCAPGDGERYMIHDTWCIDVPDPKVSDILDIVKEEKKMYTMKDFIEKPIAVRVGQDHKEEFLKMCEAEGLKWRHGDKPTDWVPDHYGDKLCISLHCKFGRGNLMAGDVACYERQKLTIVDFKDIKSREPRYQIIIDCDGKTTTAKMMVDGKEVKTGMAKWNPADKFDFSIGAKTAFDRLWGKEVTKPEPVKFKVGDRVKCTKAADGNEKTVGKQGTVKRVDNDDRLPILVDFDEDIGGHANNHRHGVKPGCGWWCPVGALELAKDEPVNPFPFKVGDRVKCTKQVDYNDDIIGKYGTVIHLAHGAGLPVTVEFDDEIKRGHAGIGRVSGKPKHCWWCHVDALELVTVREVKRPAKVGEYIKIVNPTGYTYDEYKKGDILKVVKVNDKMDYAYYKDEPFKYAYPKEYVVLEGYVPPVETVEPVKPEAKFKVGDRVVCVIPLVATRSKKGQRGTVRGITANGWLKVEFDEDIGGHDLNGKCKKGHGWVCPPKDMKVEQYKEVKRHAKAGEWVKIVKPDGMSGEKYKKGDILKVKKEFDTRVVIFSCGGAGARDEEYVVLEGYKE